MFLPYFPDSLMLNDKVQNDYRIHIRVELWLSGIVNILVDKRLGLPTTISLQYRNFLKRKESET